MKRATCSLPATRSFSHAARTGLPDTFKPAPARQRHTAGGGARARRVVVACLAALGGAGLFSSAFAAAGAPPIADSPPAEHRFVHQGVAVAFAIAPADPASLDAPRAGERARVRFTLTDATTGRPLTRRRPAAWLSRRDAPSAGQPRTCAEKVQEFLGGSIFSKADVDLNTFQVLALNDDATLTVVDPLFGFGGTRLLALVALPAIGADWILTRDGKTVYVTVPSTGQVAAIDTATWKISALLAAGPAPTRIALQPDGHYAWVAGAEGVTLIAADRREIAAHRPLPGGAQEIVFSSDSRRAFISGPAAGPLTVIDIATREEIARLPIDGTARTLAYSEASDTVYALDEARGMIIAVDATRSVVVARFPCEPGAVTLRFAPGGRFGFLANPARNLVQILDTATNRLVQRAGIEGGPEQIAFSSDMAFVRRRDTATVAMIPLKEIGREGAPVPVAEFTGGEAPFGPRTSPADGLVQAPGETAMIVANPRDKTVYYYMEGMAAPMGNFGNYDRAPRAVLVVDRSLHEVGPGVYEAAADLPAAGSYDAVFFLDSPGVAHCFPLRIAAHAPDGDAAPERRRIEALPGQSLTAGTPARIAFRLVGGDAPPAGAVDATAIVILAPGTWHARPALTLAADGTLQCEFTPPAAGLYQFFIEASALDLAPTRAPCLTLRATAPSATALP